MQNKFLWEYLQKSAKPVVMYGTGDGADKILAVMERYGLKPVCFTAGGEFGFKTFRDYAVMPFAEVERRYPDFTVLICFGSDKPEVLERLYALTERYEVYAPDVPVAADSEVAVYTPDYIAENRESLDKVRKLFADDKSREVFDGWLEYRLTGRIDVLERISSPREELLSLLKFGAKNGQDEFFIDAGAFNGDTVEEFLRITDRRFAKIIAIEPDIKNYTALRRKFYAYGSGIFQPMNAAAWSADESVRFTAKAGRGGVVGANSGGAGSGAGGKHRQIEIAGCKIDTICANCEEYKPTYIKIDTEGAEAHVLQGARSVITRHRPKMIVSLYHRNEDMFELPLLVQSYSPRYKLWLRKTRCLPGWEFNLIVSE
jgi:FkbM family methyltransferase